jgi:outer membrane protein, heavy metal efflux system
MSGPRRTVTSYRSRRDPLRSNRTTRNFWNVCTRLAACAALICILSAYPAFGQTQGPVRITLDDAVQMALQHNHSIIAARTTIQQSEAEETTANLRPNPDLFGDWDYLPFFSPSNWTDQYLHDETEVDAGLSYLIERGKKRQHRLQAAKDVTAQTRSQVADNERGLTFQVATLFYNAQLAESTLDLANEDLKNFQSSVDISETQYKAGGISENDYLKIKLQLLQFQSDVEQAEVSKVQSLSDLRQLLGYESVSADYDVAANFDYQPLKVNLEDLQMKAIQNRPDLRAAQQGVTAANSQYQLQRAIGKQDVTVQVNYSHVNSINALSVYSSIPVAVFNRNQGEILRTRIAITQAQEQQSFANGQVITDVRDAYENYMSNDRVVQLYVKTYLDVAKQSRDISEFAYRRGAASLLDFLDAERNYRSTELAYRQTLAAYLLAIEQIRQAVGTRNLQ